jgi:hypothetical protein
MEKLELDEQVDLLVSNDINGNVFAVVKKGEKQQERVFLSIQEEFDEEIIGIHVLYSDCSPNISFVANFDNGNQQPIRLTRAFIY